MNRGFVFIEAPPKSSIRIATRKQRLIAVKAMIVYLERISRAERRQMNYIRNTAAVGQQYESELIASIIDDAVFILETLDGGMYE